MKNRLLLIIMTAIFITSCNDEDVDLKSSVVDGPIQSIEDNSIVDHPICYTKDGEQIDPISARLSQKGSYWENGQTIKIKFLSGSAAAQKKVRDLANEWTKYANLKFKWVGPNENADIRIKMNEWAYYVGGRSYVGPTSKSISQSLPTMFLDGISNHSYSSIKYVIQHEFGHSLGLNHEHQNPTANIAWNKPAVYKVYMGFGWTKKEVDNFIFLKMSTNISDYSFFDPASVMMYTIHKSWTTNGFSDKYNGNLSDVDKSQIGLIYPYKKAGLKTHALYRYWSPSKGDHFYTTNWNELKGGKLGYKYEGFMGYLSPTQVEGTVPLHRYWNSGRGDHFYTTNFNTLKGKKDGWVYEGFIGYIYTKSAANRKALHRYWNVKIGDHFYTTNWNELKSGNSNWKYEGIVGYTTN